ncbi:RIP metalloprotease RseP [Methylophaga sp. OBS1]|uniref:RIP metalloprotease RseP n=1 Tax=Methylophaga sp. OBS1 TaxID=2991933 RepID=UPI00224FAE94|nr:RIP metalloprotease RseP [Methylophaga sp. OBS1]MCX4193353.1 RIP metalloprotease RseP [Methylophaga sp. OBS1]
MMSLVYFLIALSLLIVIHEYGHFWVARRCGVKVLRFSVGFGKPLWSRLGRDGTEHVIAPIPLGGYVKMLDEREGNVPENELGQAFNRQSLPKRMAIVVAGPAANLAFAVMAYWFLFVVGIPGIKPIVAEVAPQSIVAQAGMVSGDEILQIDGRDTPTWNSAFKALLRHAEQGDQAQLTVASGGTQQTYGVTIPQLAIDEAGRLFSELGMTPLRPDIAPVLEQIVPDSPAAEAGLQAGDRLLTANGKELNNWNDWVELIQQNADETIPITIRRGDSVQPLSLSPEAGEDGKGRIGAGVDTDFSRLPAELQSELRYDPVTALKEAVVQTWLFTSSTLSSLWGMLTGDVSTDNLGGPISIAQIAGSSAEQGLISFVSFLAMISITLGILNLLPIPMLDGGHLLMFIIEAMRGKPLPDEVQIRGQQIGLFLLLMLMFLAFFNDLSRLFG